MKTFVTTLFLLMLLACGAQAQVTSAPSLMNFQGRLTRPDGTPVANGTYSVRFSLWDAATGGTEKWNQTVASVNVQNGTFAVLLNVNTSNLFDGDRWLEIKLGTAAPLTPRQQIVSVAFAMKANTVPDGSLTASKFADNLFNSTAWLLSGNSGTNPASHFLGTTDNQSLIFRTNNTERMRLLASGNFGIGTTTPATRLEVLASAPGQGIRLTGTSTNSPAFGLFNGSTENGTLGLALAGGHFSTSAVAGDVVLRSVTANGKLLLQNGNAGAGLALAGNRVGIGTASPGFPLNFADTVGDKISLYGQSGAHYGFGVQGNLLQIHTISATDDIAFGYGSSTAFTETMRIKGTGSVGLGTNAPTAMLHISSPDTNAGTAWLQSAKGPRSSHIHWGPTGDWFIRSASASGNVFLQDSGGRVGIGTTAPQTTLDVNGTVQAQVVNVLGGSDVAEPYHVAPAGEVKPVPGMVVCIDAAEVGRMKVASRAYDRTVAGILSGANGVNPGITLRQKGTVADGELPVASVGRVWCLCDADANGPIVAGDMLTTSNSPGHAMRVTRMAKAEGAIIGKAMSSLKSGRGLVLVLVSLK